MNRTLVVAVALAAFFPLVIAIAAWFVVAEFVPMFDGFGVELPLSTRLLLASYRWWWLSPLIPLLVGFVWPTKDRPLAALLVGIALAIAMFLFGAWACYAPIFALAAQI